jgi:hypothetical protein
MQAIESTVVTPPRILIIVGIYALLAAIKIHHAPTADF